MDTVSLPFEAALHYLFGNHQKHRDLMKDEYQPFAKIKKSARFYHKLFKNNTNFCDKEDTIFLDILVSEESKYHSNDTRYENLSTWINKGYALKYYEMEKISDDHTNILHQFFLGDNSEANYISWRNIAMRKECHCLKKFKILKRCKKCKKVVYCSTKCQKKDWKFGNHRSNCVPVR